MGMRVEAVWKPDGERQGDHDDILYFRPTGEPDAPHESYHQPTMSDDDFATSPSSASRRRPIVARDEHRMATEMLYPRRARGAGAGAASSATPSTTRSPARPTTSTAGPSASSPRSTSWARGRRGRTRTSRWTPRSPPTTPGSHADRRVRHRHGVRLRQDVGGRARASAQPEARPLLPGAARPRPARHRGAAGERLHGAQRRHRRRPRRDRGAQPDAPARAIPTPRCATGGQRRRSCMQTPWAVEPLRRGYVPPVGESAVVPGPRRRGQGGEDVRQAGVDPRRRSARRAADARRARPDAQRGRRAGGREGAGDGGISSSAATSTWSSCCATTPVEEMILREALGLEPATATRARDQPVRRRRCAGHPIMMTGLIRLGEVFRQLSARAGDRAVPGARRAIAHATQGHCLQQNVVWVLGTRAEVDMKRPVAVVGVGQTQHTARRADVSIAGAGARGGRPRAARRRAGAQGHRRGRPRQGAGHARGRHAARAVPGRRRSART